ncbi:RNA polymerase sigma factor [Methylosinus sp. LW4]|uniref:RNA polymerase sigma factor n=1 Tax=Methylosinus sp. LW4 TaxID=136993 RepID=UPI000377D2A1|nr:sigma-70 family RNA polymerase sigma factor [Methylosinus sp. LW4]
MSDAKPPSIGELFSRNKRDLLKYLTRRFGPEDASDLLQETFLRLLRRDQGEAVADHPAFLQQIAVNLARDFSRRRKFEATCLEFGDPPEDAPTPDAPPGARLEEEEAMRALREAVAALPPRCREAFVLYVGQRLTTVEIAARLGVSRNMAQKHVRLALQRCRAALDP